MGSAKAGSFEPKKSPLTAVQHSSLYFTSFHCGSRISTDWGFSFLLNPQVKMKKEYQQKQMEKGRSPRKPSISLSAYQSKCIQAVLREE